MKIQVQAKDLNEALDVLGIVPPRAVTPQGGSGYLFVVKGGKCFIHSRDTLRRIRVEVPLLESDGDGSFIYPSVKIASMKYLTGWVVFESGLDEKDNRYWVRYESEDGASGDHSSYDPRLMQPLDEELDKAGSGSTFPVVILKEGIALTKAYLGKVGDNRISEHFQTLQLFDNSKPEWEKGDGHLFAADNIRACYFYCDAFRGKGLALHAQHLAAISSFLSKCSGEVTVKLGEGVSFAIDAKGRVLGWSHHLKHHSKFSYYPYKMDRFILRVDKAECMKSLRHIRAELDSRRDKIRVAYSGDKAEKVLQFQISDGSGKTTSIPVTVEPVYNKEQEAGSDGATQPFEANANIDHLIDLVDPMKGHKIELRLAVIAAKGQRDMALFRTTEEFRLTASGKVPISEEDLKEEAYLCRVTRFMPSKE